MARPKPQPQSKVRARALTRSSTRAAARQKTAAIKYGAKPQIQEAGALTAAKVLVRSIPGLARSIRSAVTSGKPVQSPKVRPSKRRTGTRSEAQQDAAYKELQLRNAASKAGQPRSSAVSKGGRAGVTARKIATFGAPKGGAPMKFKKLKVAAAGVGGYFLYDTAKNRGGTSTAPSAPTRTTAGPPLIGPRKTITAGPPLIKPRTASSGDSGQTKTGAGGGGGGSRAATTKKKTAKVSPAKPMPTVSQSRTMWVKKGEMVGGQEVKKGYLAQYGRAEKKVSAKVKIVADTESGKRAGETWKYKTGRTVAKVKKKR